MDAEVQDGGRKGGKRLVEMEGKGGGIIHGVF